MNIKKKKSTTKPTKREKRYIKHEGYNTDLNMIKLSGRYCRIYELEAETDDVSIDFLTALTRHNADHIQLIANQKEIYEVIGVTATSPEEAVEIFSGIEAKFPHEIVSCNDWFNILSLALTSEPFVPDVTDPTTKKRKRLKPCINRVQPYSVKHNQTNVVISDKVYKTAELIGFPSKIFPAFTTELLSISPHITFVLHWEVLDKEKCLSGLSKMENISESRKEIMKETLTSQAYLYNSCALVRLEGTQEEVDALWKKVSALCTKYLTSIAELDFLQGTAFKATLPLLQNGIHYNRVLTEDNFVRLLPYSELQQCKNTIFYGEDIIQNNIYYNRLYNMESGFILSTNYEWSIKKAIEEVEQLVKCGGSSQKIGFIVDENFKIKRFGIQKESTFDINYNDASEWLYKPAIESWAIWALSVNGKTMPKHVHMVKKAIELSAGENFSEFLLSFLSNIDVNEKRTLNTRRFKFNFSIPFYETDHGTIYQVTGSEMDKKLAYALLLSSIEGVLYCLDFELCSDLISHIELKENSLYTFIAKDCERLYNSKLFEEMINVLPFIFLGEHTTREKLNLCRSFDLQKDYRNWISAPGKGAVLITRFNTYMIEKET